MTRVFFDGDPILARALGPYYLYMFFLRCTLFSAVLVPFFTEWAKLDQLSVQLLQSWFMFWLFAFQIPTGAFADLCGRKCSLIAGAACLVGATCVYVQQPTLGNFMVAEVCFAIGHALTGGADKAFVHETLIEHNKLDSKLAIASDVHKISLLGMLIGAPIGSWIASQYGLAAPMLLSGIPFALAMLLGLRLREPAVHEARQPYWTIVGKGIQFLRSHKTVQILMIDSTLVASSAYFIIWLYQRVLRDNLQVPIWQLGYFHIALTVGQIIVAGHFGRLRAGGRGTRRFLMLGSGLVALSFLLLATTANYLTVLFFLLVGGGFGLTRLELMTTQMNTYIPPEQRATVLSGISMIRQLTIVVLNPLVGYVADYNLALALGLLSLLPITALFLSKMEDHMFQ